jgi:hypothetical protein
MATTRFVCQVMETLAVSFASSVDILILAFLGLAV